jgi:3',5'-cyclic AMP phosphodiesterase CpdA
MATFTLAHLSDPHLGPMPAPRAAELFGKRALGFFNWHRSRKYLHRPEVLAALVADLKAQTAAHIAVTGDLVNVALAAEFGPARALLDRLGAPVDVTLVPGNHDVYVRGAETLAERHWGSFMRGDDGAAGFPFVRRRGPLALIGTSTGVPTPPFMATGWLGDAQRAKLADTLASLRQEGLFRVVLIHHPPTLPHKSPHKRMTDAAEFRDIIARHGAELILRGHDHEHALEWLAGPDGARVPAIGVPSASVTYEGRHSPAAYNLYEINGASGAWRCEMISRGIDATHRIVEQRRQTLLSN